MKRKILIYAAKLKPFKSNMVHLDSIAVSVFADIFIELTNRQQDPNDYSDTVTRVLSRCARQA